MTEPRKIRVCDLKPGDRVKIYGIERLVYRVNGSVYFASIGRYQKNYDKIIKGSKSQEWVELIKRDEHL